MRNTWRERLTSFRRLQGTVVACLLVGLSCSSGCAERGTYTSSQALTDAAVTTASAPAPTKMPVTFAVIGDYGVNDRHERAVASLVASWNPAFVITTGDNYCSEAGGAGTGKYDDSTGAYYGRWLKDISTTGFRMPVGQAQVNAFFPSLGNHDYTDAHGPESYLKYFALPGAGFSNTSGNERYYDYVQGPIHFFVLNSNAQEPDGTSSMSRQGQWLQRQLAASTSPWNVVYEHHPPYSSDNRHGPSRDMQWPFAAWGADVVISGHVHTYERIMRDGIVYFINGMGGQEPLYAFAALDPGSAARYSGTWGAQKVTATEDKLVFEFYNVAGALVDSYELVAKQASGN